MILVRFKVTCRPEKTEHAMAMLREVIGPSRDTNGVISFDIARDLSDPNSFVAIEVFEDRAALESQESLAEVQRVIEQLDDFVAIAPEATIYNVSSSQPWG